MFLLNLYLLSYHSTIMLNIILYFVVFYIINAIIVVFIVGTTEIEINMMKNLEINIRRDSKGTTKTRVK